MACDEAPAVTIGDLDENGMIPSEAERPTAGQFRRHGPISVVAAEIHRGKASGVVPDGASSTSTIQMICQYDVA
jgi:hypothetical protein